MKKGKMSRTMTIVVTTAMATALMTGCVDQMPDMTQEQTDLIAEYAANLLLKYSPNYNYKIVDTQELEEITEMTEEALEESTEKSTETKEEQTAQESQTQVQETETGEAQQNIFTPQEAKIAEFMDIENFEIEYVSYEVANAYPQGTSGFAVSAPKDKMLLILHYNVSNVSEAKATCELLEKEASVYVNINDTGYRETMNTLLVNDFASYVEEFNGKETKDVVSVIAIPKETKEIESLELQIRFSNQEITVKAE